MKKKYIFSILKCIIIIFFYSNPSFADIVTLKDKSVIIGKIITQNKRIITFKNSYGLFKIRRSIITKIFISKDYKDDIKFLSKMGITIDEEAIKKDYFAGYGIKKKKLAKHKEIASKKKKDTTPDRWTGGQIAFSGTYYSIIGQLKKILTIGYGGQLTFDQGLDGLMDNKRHFWFPGIRIETDYQYYGKDMAKLSITSASSGPKWLLPLGKNHRGKIVLSVLPGLSYLQVKKWDIEKNSISFSLNSIMGYEYFFEGVSFFIHTRHVSVFDRDVNLNSIGGTIGIGYALW